MYEDRIQQAIERLATEAPPEQPTAPVPVEPAAPKEDFSWLTGQFGDLSKAEPQLQSSIGPLRKVWAGFKQGVYGEAEVFDMVAGIVSNAVGIEKPQAFQKIMEYVKPSPEEVAATDIPSRVLRGIGSAIPIIAEFAIGTKGVGLGLRALGAPAAIKVGKTGLKLLGKEAAGTAVKAGAKGVIGTAAPLAFGGIEAGKAAIRGEPIGEVAKQFAGGAAMGTGLELLHPLPWYAAIPGGAGIFGGAAAAEGGSLQDVITSAIVGGTLVGGPRALQIPAAIRGKRVLPTPQVTTEELGKPSIEGASEASKAFVIALTNRNYDPEVLNKLDVKQLRFLIDEQISPNRVSLNPAGELVIAEKAKGKKKIAEQKSEDELKAELLKSSDTSVKDEAVAELKSRSQKRKTKAKVIEEAVAPQEATTVSVTEALDANRAKFQTIAQDLTDQYTFNKKAGAYLINPEALKRVADDYWEKGMPRELVAPLVEYLEGAKIRIVTSKIAGAETKIKDAIGKLTKEREVISLAGMGEGIADALYDSMWERLQKTGRASPFKKSPPFEQKIEALYKKGRIKSAEDIKNIANPPTVDEWLDKEYGVIEQPKPVDIEGEKLVTGLKEKLGVKMPEEQIKEKTAAAAALKRITPESKLYPGTESGEIYKASQAEKAGIPFMITNATKAVLRKLGFDMKQIGEMKPETAQTIVLEKYSPEEVSISPYGELKIVKPFKTERAYRKGKDLSREEAKALWEQSKIEPDVFKKQFLHEQVYAALQPKAKEPKTLTPKAVEAGLGKIETETGMVVPKVTIKKKAPPIRIAEEDYVNRAIADKKMTDEQWKALGKEEKRIAEEQLAQAYDLEDALKNPKTLEKMDPEMIGTFKADLQTTIEDFRYVIDQIDKGTDVRTSTLSELSDIYKPVTSEELAAVSKLKLDKMKSWIVTNLGWEKKTLKSIKDENVAIDIIKNKKSPEGYEITKEGQIIPMGAEIAKARELEKMKATATDLGIDDEVKAMMSFGTEGAKTATVPALIRKAAYTVDEKVAIILDHGRDQYNAEGTIQKALGKGDSAIYYVKIDKVNKATGEYMRNVEGDVVGFAGNQLRGIEKPLVGTATVTTPEGLKITGELAGKATPEEITATMKTEDIASAPSFTPDELVQKAFVRSSADLEQSKKLVQMFREASDRFDTNLIEASRLGQELVRSRNEVKRVALQQKYNEANARMSQGVTDMDLLLAAQKAIKGAGKGLIPEEFRVEQQLLIPETGFAGTIISEGRPNGGKFYIVQGATKGLANPETPGNTIYASAELTKAGRKAEYRLKVWEMPEGISPEIEDTLLGTIIGRYMKTKAPTRVAQVRGIADGPWSRRVDVSVERTPKDDLYKFAKSVMSKEDLAERQRSIREENRVLGESVQQMVPITSPNRAKELLGLTEEAKKLGNAIDFQLEELFKDPYALKPTAADMASVFDRYGDMSQSSNPVAARVGNYGIQYTLSVKYLTSRFLKMREQFLGWMRTDPEKQKEFMQHLYDVKKSTDPKILEAEKYHRFMFDTMARMFDLEEKGLYIKKYATFSYDMGKIWDFFGKPLETATRFAELPDWCVDKMDAKYFNHLKDIRQRYPEWDKMPEAEKDFVQLQYLKWGSGYSKWTYLPEEMKEILPENKFISYFQHRTAGDRLKFALKENYFDVTTAYIYGMTRDGVLNSFFLPKVNPLARSLPFAGIKGTWRHLVDAYIKDVSGFSDKGSLDKQWNSLAGFINTRIFNKNLIPQNVPREAAGIYAENLYRAALGIDTAARNLTQVLYEFADKGFAKTFKGFINYVDAYAKKTPEYRKFKDTLDITDEFFSESVKLLKRQDPTLYQRYKYYSGLLTQIVLWPMKITEHINKGIAYFAGLEEAAARGYNFERAHLVGLRKAVEGFKNLEYSEGQWSALQNMRKTQFGYGKGHTSPYLTGTGMRFFTPFWSFPIKTGQMLYHGLKDSWLAGEKAKFVRFLALTGFIASAPVILGETIGIDTSNLWGMKGILPAVSMPAWYNFMKNAWISMGYPVAGAVLPTSMIGEPPNPRAREQAFNQMKEGAFIIAGVPQYRFGKKLVKEYGNVERGYTTYGRGESPFVETTWWDGFINLMG